MTGTIVTFLMPAVTASLLGVLEQFITFLAVPSYMGSYAFHFSFGQRECFLGVGAIAAGMFIGLGPEKN